MAFNFRERVNELCKKKGINQKILAERIGVSSISLNITLGGQYPSLQTLEKVANVLGVEVIDLFPPKKSTIITCPDCGARLKVVVTEVLD